MRLLLCLVFLSSFAASSALRLRATATARHSQPRCQFKTGEGEPVGDDKAQRRQNLKDLFGEQAADSLAPLTKSERAEAQVDEILMLQEGMQSLSWGGIRLVDVDMAPYATQGSNPGLADPGSQRYSYVRALPWTGALPSCSRSPAAPAHSRS